MLQKLIVLMLITFVWFSPRSLSADFDLLAAVPAQYEFVASVNTRQVVDSSLFQEVWPKIKKPESDAQLAVLQAISGVDLLKDVDRISVFSMMNDDDSVGVVFEGRFEEEKLLLLIQATGTYKNFELGKRTVHEWFDQKENRTKFAHFSQPGVLIVYNSRRAMEVSIAAMDDATASLRGSSDATIVPAQSSGLAAWAVLISRDVTRPGAKLRIRTATMTTELIDNSLLTEFQVVPETAQDAENWLQMVRGARAFSLLQRDNAVLASLAERLKVEPLAGDRGVDMSLLLTNAELLAIATQSR